MIRKGTDLLIILVQICSLFSTLQTASALTLTMGELTDCCRLHKEFRFDKLEIRGNVCEANNPSGFGSDGCNKNVLFCVSLTVSLMFTFCAGLLKVGTPKTWKDSRKDLGYIRKAGVRQFISTYNRVRDLKGDELLWVR